MAEIEKTDEEWHEILTPEQFEVLRRAGTERPWSGKYVDTHDDGTYHCAACGAELFDASTKFESGSGWPSFYEPKVAEAVELIEDRNDWIASLPYVQDAIATRGQVHPLLASASARHQKQSS